MDSNTQLTGNQEAENQTEKTIELQRASSTEIFPEHNDPNPGLNLGSNNLQEPVISTNPVINVDHRGFQDTGTQFNGPPGPQGVNGRYQGQFQPSATGWHHRDMGIERDTDRGRYGHMTEHIRNRRWRKSFF
jgi:hypothetical protein